MQPEKNDVDISKLFNWGRKFSLYDTAGNPLNEYYQRLPTDKEVNIARVSSLRASAELRKKLRTKDSDERVAFIVERELVEPSQLIDYIVYYKSKEIVSKAYSEVDVPQPRELKSSATLEEQEKYQQEVDTWNERREAKVRLYVEDVMEKERKSLENLTPDEIYKSYEDSIIEDMCQKEMIMKYRDMCTYFGCFKDEKYSERLLESVDALSEFPVQIKEQFLANYLSLDINVEELKK